MVVIGDADFYVSFKLKSTDDSRSLFSLGTNRGLGVVQVPY